MDVHFIAHQNTVNVYKKNISMHNILIDIAESVQMELSGATTATSNLTLKELDVLLHQW